MSTESNHPTMTDESDDESPFDPVGIRRRLPASLSHRQERALIAAIRNPDASVSELADATAVKPRQIRHALDSVACGVLGADTHSGEWVEKRGGEARKAETFAELTPKQAAVVDFLARTPSFDWEEQTSRTLLAAITNANEGEAADAPEMHYTHPKTVAQEYESLIYERRAYLVTHEGLDLDTDEADTDGAGLRPVKSDAVRDLLATAGYALPDENLDSLAASDGRGATPGRICEACMEPLGGLLVCPECPSLDVYGGVPVEDHRKAPREAFDEDDVQKGVVYEGVINGVKEYGVFVTVGNDRGDRNDVSGLMPRRLVPDRVDLRTYGTGDVVRVVLDHREDAETETGDRLFFAWPSESRVEGHRGETDETAVSADESETSPEPVTPTADTSDDDEGDTDERMAALDELRKRITEQSRALGEARERIDSLERENERLRERVAENAEALPSAEEIEELNEAVETVLGADARLDAISEKLATVDERLEVAKRQIKNDLAPIEAFENLDRRIKDIEDGTTDDANDLSDTLDTLREQGFEGEFTINL